MKSFEEFRQEQLDEAVPLAAPLAAGAKWALGGWLTKKGLDAVDWTGRKAKDAAGAVVNQAKKTAKKAWDGGDTKISGVKGRDEKGLPSSN